MGLVPHRVLVRTARQNIGLLCSFIAAYEGVAIVRTLDPGAGLVELLIAPDFYTTALDILQALARDMELAIVPEVHQPSAVPGSHGAREADERVD